MPLRLQGAQFQDLQYLVKDNGEAITTWCLLEFTFLEECWKRFGYFSDFYQRSSSCWSSASWIRTRGQPKASYTRFGFPPLALFPRMVWSCME